MEKITNLRKFFSIEKIDGYIIPKNDEFFGEYISKSKDRLNFISGFSGSFGFALILKDRNYLFVDGRYTLQANNQSGKYFKIITIPKIMPYQILKNKKLSLGFDPKLFTKNSMNIFFGEKNFILKPIEENLIDKIWRRKTTRSRSFFYMLPKHSIGNNFKSKINKVVLNLKKYKADLQLITASENNAWLFNIRGKDSEYAPIPLSHALIDQNKGIKLFCNLKNIPKYFKKSFAKVKFCQFSELEKILFHTYNKKFIIDKNSCSLFFEKIILKKNSILNISDPIYHMKAIKSKNEIRNIEKAHIDDGVALTKYLFWIKNNFIKKRITEISGSNKLLQLRKKNKKFKFLSFPTISSTGPNGAIIHYKATKKTDRRLKKGDIYLVDSGGQYEFGTTDVTRTISLKNENKRIKNIFTRVLKGHIAVSNYKFKKKTSGSNIDISARKYLKKINLDFAHGTGHGVGYFLNVHEGPHAISKNNKIILKEGMILSNEPGYYEKNNFGIRIENLVYVKKEKNIKKFKNLTMVPIDKDLIDKGILDKSEKSWINNYHKKVFLNLKFSMNKKEIKDLKKACSAI